MSEKPPGPIRLEQNDSGWLVAIGPFQNRACAQHLVEILLEMSREGLTLPFGTENGTAIH